MDTRTYSSAYSLCDARASKEDKMTRDVPSVYACMRHCKNKIVLF